ncbi:MAG TPA: hypothetical protein VMO00_02935 [Methylomirabilota bacterium]|nr:hypothetical protein [Methylomirabilota bacterium]
MPRPEEFGRRLCFDSGFGRNCETLEPNPGSATFRRFGRVSVAAIHYFKNNKAQQTVTILKRYAKIDLSTIDGAYAYIKGAVPDLPYPTLESMKTILAEMGRTRPEVLKYDAATMVDSSIIKVIDEEGFLKKLK